MNIHGKYSNDNIDTVYMAASKEAKYILKPTEPNCEYAFHADS